MAHTYNVSNIETKVGRLRIVNQAWLCNKSVRKKEGKEGGKKEGGKECGREGWREGEWEGEIKGRQQLKWQF